MNLNYRRIRKDDAEFFTRIFSISEYDLYFAENATTVDEWGERFIYYEGIESNIILDGNKPIGWIMYEINGDVCDLHIVVLLDTERHKGYGNLIFNDLIEKYPTVSKIILDVQQRNIKAFNFYKKLGFEIVSEESQPVGDGTEMYYNLELNIR